LVTQAEVTKENLEPTSIPEKVETTIDTLDFFDGVPFDATMNKE
jgi:hypothetical protein